MKANPTCRVCDVELTDENWYPSYQKENRRLCKECKRKQYKQWRITNPDKAKAGPIRHKRRKGVRPYNKNKECASYLGVHIAEQVLSQAFKDVKRMPYGNPGYDVTCNRDKKIDIKSACIRKNGGWKFAINHNTIADYFLCLAFDNREDLNPLHAWLLPGNKFNHLSGVGISPNTVHRWDEYRLDISKISSCCDIMKL